VIRFLILGVVTTLIDYITYAILIYSGINYAVSATIGYSLGIVANYYGGRAFVFTKGSKLSSQKSEFLIVLFISIVGLGLNILTLFVLSDYFKLLDFYTSRIVALGITFFWNYFARKRFVYH